MNTYRYWKPGNITGTVQADTPKDAAVKALDSKYADVAYSYGDWHHSNGAVFINYNGQTVTIWSVRDDKR